MERLSASKLGRFFSCHTEESCDRWALARSESEVRTGVGERLSFERVVVTDEWRKALDADGVSGITSTEPNATSFFAWRLVRLEEDELEELCGIAGGE